MGIKIVTGGTTGLQDGTLVSSGNRLTFTGAGNVSAHVRCDDGYWSADQAFDLQDITGVLPLEVSFNGGSTWLDDADNPVCPEIEDVNFPILLRQTAPVGVGETAREFSTPGDAGTYTAIAALSTPTLTATANGASQIDLSWTNVANEDGYTLDRSTAADFSANLVSVSKGAGVTTHQATGLTSGVTYYFRVRAEGSGRYSDSGYGTDDAVPPAVTTVTIGSDYATALANEGPYGICSDGTNTWAVFRGTGSVAKITPSGTITVYVINASAGLYNICYGPDGNLWITDWGRDYIIKMSTAGSVLGSYATTAGAGAFGICTDGTDLFFTEYLTLKVSKITTGGTISQRTTVAGAPSHMCIGPDGNVWASLANNKVAKYVVSGGAVTEYALTGAAAPNGICSDGTKLWVSCTGTSKIAQMSTAGVETVLGTTVADARYICADPSGNIWYTQYTDSKVGVVTAAGSFLTAQGIAHGTGPLGIVFVGGKAWFCVNYPGGSNKGYIGTATAS